MNCFNVPFRLLGGLPGADGLLLPAFRMLRFASALKYAPNRDSARLVAASTLLITAWWSKNKLATCANALPCPPPCPCAPAITSPPVSNENFAASSSQTSAPRQTAATQTAASAPLRSKQLASPTASCVPAPG